MKHWIDLYSNRPNPSRVVEALEPVRANLLQKTPQPGPNGRRRILEGDSIEDYETRMRPRKHERAAPAVSWEGDA